MIHVGSLPISTNHNEDLGSAEIVSRSNKDGFRVTTKSDGRSWIEQPARWWADHSSVVCSCRFTRRDWKHCCISTNLPRTMGTDILGLFPCRDCRLLPEFRCLFRGLNSCLAD